MTKSQLAYEIDDGLSVLDNLKRFEPKLVALHPTLGPALARYLIELMENPASDKSLMLTVLRDSLDLSPIKSADKDGVEQ